jgi:hypothetical protein
MPTCSPCATVRSECVHSPSASQHSDTLAGHACIHHFHTDLHVLRWGVGQAQSDWAECTAHAPHKLIINLGAEFFFETSTSFNLTQTSRRLKLHQAVRHVLKGNTFCCFASMHKASGALVSVWTSLCDRPRHHGILCLCRPQWFQPACLHPLHLLEPQHHIANPMCCAADRGWQFPKVWAGHVYTSCPGHQPITLTVSPVHPFDARPCCRSIRCCC